MSKRWLVLVIVVLVGVGIAIMGVRVTSSKPITQPPSAPPAIADSNAAPLPREGREVRKPPRPSPPPELTGFYGMTSHAQLALITGMEQDPALSSGVVAFLKAAIRDSMLDATLRNNMANCLLVQNQPDPYLDRIFLAMIVDAGESETWRNYSVQLLAACVPSSAEPEAIVDALRGLMASGPLDLPATAMLQLHRLDRQGHVHLDAGFTAPMLASLDDPAADLLFRMTALSIVAERQEVSALPSVRRLSMSDLPSLRRIAIAALGSVGEEVDRARLQAAINDSDPGTVFAARDALERLAQRVSADKSQVTQ